MVDAIALNETSLVGLIIVVLVFGILRFMDEIVDVIVSLDDESTQERTDPSESKA